MPLPRKQSQAPAASLDPSEFSSGFQIPDGNYNIKVCQTGLHTYGGSVPDGVPAFLVLYEDDNGQTYEQPYKAGDNEHLAPSEDGETFVHPDGQSPAKIYGNGAAAMWLKSWKEAGHVFNGNVASQFQGLRVRLQAAAAPKGKTGDNPDRTIPIIAKILAAQGKPPTSRPTARTTGAKSAASAVASSRTAPATSASNGELNDAALALVMQVLEKAADQTMPIPKLAMGVYMAAQKDADYKPNASAIKKLITAEWLGSQEGIEADDDNAALA